MLVIDTSLITRCTVRLKESGGADELGGRTAELPGLMLYLPSEETPTTAGHPWTLAAQRGQPLVSPAWTASTSRKSSGSCVWRRACCDGWGPTKCQVGVLPWHPDPGMSWTAFPWTNETKTMWTWRLGWKSWRGTISTSRTRKSTHVEYRLRWLLIHQASLEILGVKSYTLLLKHFTTIVLKFHCFACSGFCCSVNDQSLTNVEQDELKE